MLWEIIGSQKKISKRRSMRAKILIVDDEELFLDSLGEALSNNEYKIFKASRGKDAIDGFKKLKPDVVILDVRLPDIDGMKVLQKIKELDADENTTIVIMMTAFSGIKGAVEAIKLGAYDYVAKPFDIEELKIIISRCLESRNIMAEVNQIRAANKQKYNFNNIITNNQSMHKVIGIAKRVSGKSTANVLILGESGTGKELIANAIHYNSPRSDRRLITVNCSSLAPGVIESELFGHEKGAFTGAVKPKKGFFEEADKGTIFLDEIGEIDQKIQAKLLRCIENRTFQRVGGTEDIEVDVRIIAATNKDLLHEVKNEKFREDLYYRLNVVSISLPPLRQRKEDISLLVDYYIREFSCILNKNVTGCTKDVYQILVNYEWPGNIRELRNVIERAVLLCDASIIDSSDLSIELSNNKERSFISKLNDLEEVKLDDIVRMYSENILKRCGQNRSKAACVLGISRPRLNRILK